MFRRLRQLWRWLRQGLTRGVVWDIFMVYLALLNLGLILFDLTYLWLRPAYFRLAPAITRLYDPVKGIEPNRTTERYLEETRALAEGLDAGAGLLRTEATLAELRGLSMEMLENNPFERSGQERNLYRILLGMQHELEREGIVGANAMTHEETVALFWSLQPEPGRLDSRVVYFDRDLTPMLEVNFYRRYNLDGELTDHFWMLDLPFLIIFIVEFFTRWYLAIRRATYPRWFFFPIFNWYDLLGIIPIKQMRLFRLVRIVSIYIRLARSEHSMIGDDPVSRTVKYFSNIISEEISDMVAVRILNETQEELRDGTHKRIVRTVAENHREALAAQLALQTRDLLTNAAVRDQARRFLGANLENAIGSAAALRRLPLPDAVLQPLVKTVGEAVFDAFADTLAATLSSDDGQTAVRALIADAVDGLILEFTEGQLEEIVREISIEVIGHMKDTVAVRKWTLPDQPRRTLLTRDVID